MARITETQVQTLRDQGIIDQQTADRWLRSLQAGNVLDVPQRMVDQAGPALSLPDGVTQVSPNEIEVDFRQVTRQGILEMNRADIITSDQAQDFLRRQRETSQRPEGLGGQLVSAARFAFDPTDPRGVVELGPVPVKAGLGVAGLGAALPAVATGAAFPSVAPAITGALAGGGAPIGTRAAATTGQITRAAGAPVRGAGRFVRRHPLITGALGLAGGIGGVITLPQVLGGGGEEAAPGAAELPEDIDTLSADERARRIAEREEKERRAVEDAAAAADQVGAGTEFITGETEKFNPLTGQVETFETRTPVHTITTLNELGDPVTRTVMGEAEIPDLDQAIFEYNQTRTAEKTKVEQANIDARLQLDRDTFNEEQTEAKRQFDLAQERQDLAEVESGRRFGLQQEAGEAARQLQFTQGLPSLIEAFAASIDPRVAARLRVAQAQQQGLSTVPGLALTEALAPFFGRQAGQELRTGLAPAPFETVGGVSPSAVASTFGGKLTTPTPEALKFFGPGGPRPATVPTGPFGLEALSALPTPGFIGGLSPEEQALFEVALGTRGLTREGVRKEARKSALPGGGRVRARVG